MMKRLFKAALASACLAMPLTASASNECEGNANQQHEIRILFNGFFPTNTYACPGDTITFLNKSGRYANFLVKDPANLYSSSYLWKFDWKANNSSRTYVIPNGVDGLVLTGINLSGASNNDYPGSVIFGPAPDSY